MVMSPMLVSSIALVLLEPLGLLVLAMLSAIIIIAATATIEPALSIGFLLFLDLYF
jgi:hypothetical protein